MEIKIVIDAPKGWKRRVLFFVVTPTAMVAAVALVARATVQNVDGSWVQSGGPVSAASLANDLTAINANFASLDQRLTAVEAFKSQATADGGYSLGGTYCGATAPTTGALTSGTLTSYAAAKAQCAQVPGCSATAAHMCTSDEILRTEQLGKSITFSGTSPGWYSSGTFGYYPSPPASRAGTFWDCAGWTAGNDTNLGAAWYPSGGNVVYWDYCSNSDPILCCD